MVKLENIVQLYSMQIYTLDKKWKQVCRINLFSGPERYSDSIATGDVLVQFTRLSA